MYKAQWTVGTIKDGGCFYNIRQVKTNSSYRTTVCRKAQHLFGTLHSALSASNYATKMFVRQVHIVQLKPLSQETQTDYGTPIRLTKRRKMYRGKLDETKGNFLEIKNIKVIIIIIMLFCDVGMGSSSSLEPQGVIP